MKRYQINANVKCIHATALHKQARELIEKISLRGTDDVLVID